MALDTPKRPTRIVAADKDSIAQGAKLLREGRLVGFPTETVYGLGANALDEDAVAAIFAAKERPRFNPLIVHVRDFQAARELVQFNGAATALAEAFWPGGLTLVLPRREPCPLALLVSGGLSTAAIRAPAHPTARSLVEAAGVPIAAPSANRAGRISPTSAADAADELQGRVDLILDGGPCPLGIESTVIGFDGENPILLRPGAIPRGDIENLIGRLLDPDGAMVQAPGMMLFFLATVVENYERRGKQRFLLPDDAPCFSLLASSLPCPRPKSSKLFGRPLFYSRCGRVIFLRGCLKTPKTPREVRFSGLQKGSC